MAISESHMLKEQIENEIVFLSIQVEQRSKSQYMPLIGNFVHKRCNWAFTLDKKLLKAQTI